MPHSLPLSAARFSVVPGGRVAPAPQAELRPLERPRVLAAIDVGSNCIKLLVARVTEGTHLAVLVREKSMVRLGHGTLLTGRLSAEAMDAGVACLARFAELARAAGAERIVCAATCAVREAENGAELARRVKEKTDLDLEVISGEEEARLITRAVRTDFAASADPLLVIDIGGGSTEVILSSGQKTPLAESLELGAVRLTDRYVTTDPVSARSVAALRDEVDRRVKRLAKAVRSAGFRTAVGTSGTIAALADLAASLEGRPGAEAGHRTLSRKSLRRVVDTLVATPTKELGRMPGVDPRRADILVAGALLLERLMDRLAVKKLLVCDRSLRDGLLLDQLDERTAGGAEVSRDVRRESVLRLARRSHLEWPHAERTRDLALRLFDRTHSLHQLADREREWLEYAAFLHDLGTSVSYLRHHRHAAYLITHGELAGFSSEEIDVIAQVARYHRKAEPRESHDAFARLDPWLKPVVEKLAALLRLADGLDRTHRQLVTDVDVTVLKKRVVLTVTSTLAADLEVWATGKKSRLFARVFGREVDVIPSGGPRPKLDVGAVSESGER